MKRKIYNTLLDWKNSGQGRTALLIDGARRVGKSYIVRKFAQNEYESALFIDFGSASPTVKKLFDDYLDDLDTLFMHLNAFYQVKLTPRKSVVVFDEVQDCPRARAAIKYLVADGRYDYIETGSLTSLQRNVKDIIIPSEERHVKMYPMDFEEFLWANGNDMLMDFIRDRYMKQQPMGALMHRKAIDLFRQYLIVGGMPQAVVAFVETHDFGLTDRAKRDILDLYRSDIYKYATGYESKVAAVLDLIPSQLQKHEKRFKLAALAKGARFKDYENSFLWLNDAMIVNTCHNTTAPNVGLRMNMENTTLKCYLADTGLLVSLAFDESDIADKEIYRKLLMDKLEINQGMMVENVVAQMLRTAGHKLYFYSSASRDAENRMEIDFLIRKPVATSRHNISPVEVKSGKKYTTLSLQKLRAKFGQYLSTSYVIHDRDMIVTDDLVYLPYYMTPLL